MRELILKAWLKSENKIVKVECIDFHAKNICYRENGSIKVAVFKFIELVQFTGLLDKNGIKIFEGDIVKIQKENPKTGILQKVEYQVNYKPRDSFEVFWNDSLAMYNVWGQAGVSIDNFIVEIIGNNSINKRLKNE